MQIIFLMGCISIRHQANLAEFFSILATLLQMDLVEIDPEETDEREIFREENPRLVNNGYETPVLFESAFTLVLGFGINIVGLLLGLFFKQRNFVFSKDKELEDVEANVGEVSFFRPRNFTAREQYLVDLYKERQRGFPERVVTFVIDGFVYSAFLRGALECAVDLGICSLIDLKYFKRAWELNVVVLSIRRVFSLVFSALSISMYLVLPAFIYVKVV